MDPISQLRASIIAQSLPHPSTSFLTSLVSARSPPPPLPSLMATAKARLLASDLTSSAIISSSSAFCFPPGTNSPESRERRLPRPVHVQVLDVENLALSRWEQIEEMEAIARGEATRGREVVHVTEEGDDQAPSVRAAGKNATHRLVLQDSTGAKIYALELRRMDGIGVGKTQIGEKMLLKTGTVVARGTVLLEPTTCVLLGGRVEAWQRAWVEGRLTRLREAVEDERRDP